MADVWSMEQVMALAPDASSVTAAEKLAALSSWSGLARDDRAAWGLARGSGKTPYSCCIDLAEPAFRCSCPSRKFPCKHGLALLMLLARSPKEIARAGPPGWVTEWLDARRERAAKQVERAVAATSAGPADPKAQARRVAQREAKVAAARDDLLLWLCDLVRGGLAAAQGRPAATWHNAAARMVDGQAPGLGRRVRALGEIVVSGAGWQARLLDALGALYLLLRTHAREAELDPPLRAEVRTQMGFTIAQESLLAAPGARDRWYVIAQTEHQEERISVQRTWLRGESTGACVYVIEFTAGGQTPVRTLVPGTSLEGELSLYPGPAPQRAAVREPRAGFAISAPTYAGEPLSAALDRYADALARNPWLDRWPMFLSGAIPQLGDGMPSVRDETSHSVSLVAGDDIYALMALSGGHGVTLFGEWDGAALHARAAWSCDGFLALGSPPANVRAPLPSGAAGELFEQLVAASVLGAASASPAPPWADPASDLDPALRASLDGVTSNAPPEARLLAAAALVAQYLRAGLRPAPARGVSVAACPPESLEVCPSAIVDYLAGLDPTTDALLVEEWANALAARGWRAPATLLPRLLGLASRATSLRAAFAPILGERGRWLAQWNPDWSYARAGEPAEPPASLREEWERATLRERLAHLARARQVSPALGRELLLSTFDADPPAERAQLVAGLFTGLSLEDEPFLERALDDGRAEVRRAAARLLASLPQSALAGRMRARLEGALRYRPGSKLQQIVRGAERAAQLEVEPPAACDAAMVRDGIDAKASGGRGARARWLEQMLGCVPPSEWCEKLGIEPTALVRAARACEYADAVLDGLTAAAIRHADAPVAEALLLLAGDRPHALPDRLASVLDTEAAGRTAVSVAAAQPALFTWLGALQPFAVRFDADASRALVRQLAERLVHGSASHGGVARMLEGVAARIATETLGELVTLLDRARQKDPERADRLAGACATAERRLSLMRALDAHSQETS